MALCAILHVTPIDTAGRWIEVMVAIIINCLHYFGWIPDNLDYIAPRSVHERSLTAHILLSEVWAERIHWRRGAVCFFDA